MSTTAPGVKARTAPRSGGAPRDERPEAPSSPRPVSWVVRPRAAEGDGPPLHELAGLAEELGYPLRYVAGLGADDRQQER